MTSFDVYGEKGQLMRGRAVDSDITQSRFAQTTRTWRNSLTDRLAGFDTELDTLYGDTIDLIYPVGTSGKNQGKILSNNNLSSPGVAQRLTRIMGKVEANQNSPKFVLDRSTGKYIVQGNATPASLAATKGLAGFLFAEAVRAEGSVDFPDWFADTFAQRSEGQDLGQILDRVRYTETPNGQIDEIFYVDSNGAELDGSIKVPELIGNFGQEGSYARNLLLAYIAKDGRLRKQ